MGGGPTASRPDRGQGCPGSQIRPGLAAPERRVEKMGVGRGGQARRTRKAEGKPRRDDLQHKRR